SPLHASRIGGDFVATIASQCGTAAPFSSGLPVIGDRQTDCNQERGPKRSLRVSETRFALDHAAALYSWMRPSSTSRRRTWSRATSVADLGGGFWIGGLWGAQTRFHAARLYSCFGTPQASEAGVQQV